MVALAVMTRRPTSPAVGATVARSSRGIQFMSGWLRGHLRQRQLGTLAFRAFGSRNLVFQRKENTPLCPVPVQSPPISPHTRPGILKSLSGTHCHRALVPPSPSLLGWKTRVLCCCFCQTKKTKWQPCRRLGVASAALPPRRWGVARHARARERASPAGEVHNLAAGGGIQQPLRRRPAAAVVAVAVAVELEAEAWR